MGIKYEIQSIKNAQGTGSERLFARIYEDEPMTADELEDSIQTCCTLTKGDVKAVLSALRDNMISALSHGRRVYLPSIGYFSLSVDTDIPEGKPLDKMRGDYISVRNIRFRPEASMLRDVKTNARFERATFTTKSTLHTEEAMSAKIKEYLSTERFLNRRVMQDLFGLRQNAALKWLKHFTDTGLLKKEGARNAPVYFLNQ